MNVSLVGNPNTGKTTLFNSLTNSYKHTGNWNGVTVEQTEKEIKIGKNIIKIVDLPGIYSLNPTSYEERLTVEYLNKNKNESIINICDERNLRKNLSLTLELIKRGYKILMLVNTFGNKNNLSFLELQKFLNIPIFYCDFSNVKIVKNMFKQIEKVLIKLSAKFTNNSIKDINLLNFNIILNNYEKLSNKRELNWFEKKLISKVFLLPIILIIFYIIFWITFGWIGNTLTQFFEYIFIEKIGGIITNFLLEINSVFWIYDLFENGILKGVGIAIQFFPQLLLLLMCFNFLEQWGFFSYVAFMFDGVLKKIGLTGKSVYSMIMGFGCTTTAVIATRNLENENIRKSTTFTLPFFVCSAKVPVFLVLISLFFTNGKFLIVLGLYFLSFIIGIFLTALKKKPQQTHFFAMEIPKLKFPKASTFLRESYALCKEFFNKIFGLILIMSVLVWFASSFNFNLEYIGMLSTDSILIKIGKLFKPIFGVIGLGNEYIIASLLIGIFAKELILSSLVIMCETGLAELEILTLASVVSLITFILLYTPCITCLVCVKKEFGIRTTIYLAVKQVVVAFICSFFAYNIIRKPIFGIILFCFALLLAIIRQFVLKYRCTGNCKSCVKNAREKG